MPNARSLSIRAGATGFERLSRYLPEADAVRAARAVDTIAIVVDSPGSAASTVAQAVRVAGGSAWVERDRLVVTGSRDTFARAAADVSGAAHTLAAEVLRACVANALVPAGVRLRDRTLDLSERARVMGILNVTPNSFFDQGRYAEIDRARARAAEMVALGADLIDIGGQSYSSTSPQVAAEEEAERVIPVVRALLADGISVPLSIDTFRASVAERALDAGAHLINDCSGLSDERMAAVVAEAGAALVVMHLKGRLNVREASYIYDDTMAEILDYLRVRTDRAQSAGVGADAIVVDPGLEFGKEPVTDLEILERFGDLRSLGFPILFAASRKNFISRIFGQPSSELLVPSLASAAIGIAAGARLVRVHDVAETVAVTRMFGALGVRNLTVA